jgi:hypothetical protein
MNHLKYLFRRHLDASMVTGGSGGGSIAIAVATLATAITGVGTGLQQLRPLLVAHTCVCQYDTLRVLFQAEVWEFIADTFTQQRVLLASSRAWSFEIGLAWSNIRAWESWRDHLSDEHHRQWEEEQLDVLIRHHWGLPPPGFMWYDQSDSD